MKTFVRFALIGLASFGVGAVISEGAIEAVQAMRRPSPTAFRPTADLVCRLATSDISDGGMVLLLKKDEWIWADGPVPPRIVYGQGMGQ